MNNYEVKFVPEKFDWERLYMDKKDHVIGALVSKGYQFADAEDACEESFIKVMGLSANRHLQHELEPRTTLHWVNWMIKQAESIVQDICRKNSAWYVSNDDEGVDGSASENANGSEEALTESEKVSDEGKSSKNDKAKKRRIEKYKVLLESEACSSPQECDSAEQQASIKAWLRMSLRSIDIADHDAEAYYRHFFDGMSDEAATVAIYHITDRAKAKRKRALLRKTRERVNAKLASKLPNGCEMHEYLRCK